MRLPLVVLLPLLVLSCASNTALTRREQARAWNALELSDAEVERYRSDEGVRDAHWGITMDELRGIKGEPLQVGEGALQYREEIDGVPLVLTYVFFRGHLAEVRGQLALQQISRERLLSALKQKYGAPQREWDKAETARHELDAAARFRIALAVLDGVSLATPGPRVIAPWLLSSAQAAPAPLTLEHFDRPAHEAQWATRETTIDCALFVNDAASLSWTSRPLGRLLLKDRMSNAGIAKVAEGL